MKEEKFEEGGRIFIELPTLQLTYRSKSDKKQAKRMAVLIEHEVKSKKFILKIESLIEEIQRDFQKPITK